jgi:transposase-like protein
MKKLIAAVTTAGLLIVGTAGVASAADTPSAPAPATAPAHAMLGKGRLVAAVKIAASTIGIEPKALGQEIKDGKSVADVARSHGVNPQKVIDAIDTAADKKVDEALTAGKIDSTRAATIKDALPARVTKLVNADLQGKGKGLVARAKLRRHARRSGVAIAAGVIGVQPKALVDAVKGGQTVADVARSHGVNPQKVIDAVTTAANKKVDTAVTNGKIDAARAATLKDRLDKRITTLVNATPHKGGASS